MEAQKMIDEWTRLREQVERGEEVVSRCRKAGMRGEAELEFAEVVREQRRRVDDAWESYVDRLVYGVRAGQGDEFMAGWIAGASDRLSDEFYGRMLDDVPQWPDPGVREAHSAFEGGRGFFDELMKGL